MSDVRPRFIVMRDEGESLTSYGPSSRVFATQDDADLFAKLLASRYPQQQYVVARVILERNYTPAHNVRALRLVEGGAA